MADEGIADQSFPTSIGAEYILSVDVVTDATTLLTVSVGISIGGVDLLAAQDLPSIDSYAFSFVATSSISWVRFLQTGSIGSTYIDNVSVRRAGDLPGQRTVYIEVDTDVDTDGLASQTVLDAARVLITTDPETGQDRQPLGLTDQMLWVESIYRTGIHVVVTNLDIDADQVAAAKSAITTDVSAYLRGIRPYVDGLDPPALRNDTITKVALSRVVMDVVEFYSGTLDEIKFGVNFGQYLSSYTMNQGETAKLITPIVYD